MRLGVFGNPKHEGIEQAISVIRNSWKDVLLSKHLGGDYEDTELDELADFIVSLGGDGTFLKATKLYSKPLIGVNLGKLGFLTYFDVKDIPHVIDALRKGRYILEERRKLELEWKGKSFLALNDFYVNTIRGVALNVEVSEDGQLITKFYGDGIVISSPTGSTAYNLSAGGPIIHPQTHVFVITPICPHNLTARPIVMPDSMKIDVSVDARGDAMWRICGDGMDIAKGSENLRFKVHLSSRKVLLVRLENTRSFFSILRRKLQWR